MHRTVCRAWVQKYATASVPGLLELWVDFSRMEEECLRIHPPSGARALLRTAGDSNLIQTSIQQSNVVGERLQSLFLDLGFGNAEVRVGQWVSKLMVSVDGSGPLNPGLE